MYPGINSPYVFTSPDPILDPPDAEHSNPIPTGSFTTYDDIQEKPLGGLGLLVNSHPFSTFFSSPGSFHSKSFSDSDTLDDFSPLSMNDISSSPAALFLSSFSPNIDAPLVLPDDEGQIVAGYALGPVVGRGGFSTIRTGTSSAGDIVAIKIVRRSDVSSQPNPEAESRRLDHESQVWSSLHHEHILPLFKSHHTPYADYFVTQFCPAGSMFDILKRDGNPALPHDDVGMMFRQVVRGLQYLHDIMGYVHGDIKLENLLVDEMGICKLADFGMTRKIGEFNPAEYEHEDHEIPTPSKRRTKPSLCHRDPSRHLTPHRNSAPLRGSAVPKPPQVYQQGSLPYASPELLLPHGGSPYVPHPAQDIWALGVVLYALLTGRLPFVDSFEPRLQMKILHGAFEMPADIGPAAERVLSGCLDLNVTSRWTIAMVDEDAWGIGWSSGCSSPSSNSEVDCDPTPIHTRTRSNSVVISDSGSPPHPNNGISDESPFTRPRSRGSPSSSRSTSPSGLSRALRFIPASLSSLNDSILGIDSSKNSPTPPTADLHPRGRPRLKLTPERTDSRSLSPSVAPLTPHDLIDDSIARSHHPRKHGADSLHEDATGRTRGTSRLRWRGSDLDDGKEISAREKWSVSRSRHASRSRLRNDGSRSIERRAFDLLNKWDDSSRGRSLRTGSQPPRSSSSTSRDKRLREIDHDRYSWRKSSAMRNGVGEESIGRIKVRSRSVELGFTAEKGRTRKLAPS